MSDKELFLIYINEVGQNWKKEHIYEFIFSDSIDGVDGDDWDEFPASGKPEPPHKKHIHAIGKLKSEYKFDLVQDSDTFCVWDAVDGIIALGWENVNDYDEYPENRIYFKFGDGIKKIIDVFSERDIILEVKMISEHERFEEEY